MSNSLPHSRPQTDELVQRLREPRRFIQVIAGSRQVGKTTLAGQAAKRSGLTTRHVSADEPTLRDTLWIQQQWEAARSLDDEADAAGALLVLDEVQKVTGWSEAVKHLWDEDTRAGRRLKVVLLDSAPLLVERGLDESLAGRFEMLRLPHWSFAEMREAFGWSLEQYLFYGGYPGAAPLIRQPGRWTRYIRDSLIEPIISRDVLLLSRVDKPALLRRLLELGCAYSGQILSYTKMLGQLQDAGNTTTLAHYLDLLSGAGLVTGLRKYAGGVARRRASSPKLQALNTALITAQAGITLGQARADRTFRGRLVESAVGAHLANAAATGDCNVHYWRDRNREVDFVVSAGRTLVAIEVKSGRTPETLPGMAAFSAAFRPARKLLVGGAERPEHAGGQLAAFRPARKLLVGGDGIDLGTFLSTPVRKWLEA